MIESDAGALELRYQMVINGEDHYMEMNAAGRCYDLGTAHVKIGGLVLGLPAGTTREITDDERMKISRIADDWSDGK